MKLRFLKKNNKKNNKSIGLYLAFIQQPLLSYPPAYFIHDMKKIKNKLMSLTAQ